MASAQTVLFDYSELLMVLSGSLLREPDFFAQNNEVATEISEWAAGVELEWFLQLNVSLFLFCLFGASNYSIISVP